MYKTTDFNRTIIALATALGKGSISVIRVSGKQAISIVNKAFKGKDLSKAKGNTIHFGQIIFNSREIDHVLVSVFKAPHSYTGEHYVEISCHANPYIVDDIIKCLTGYGAFPAKAGEFTLRAFLNGKIDLSQAEAVANIIEAKSKAGVQNALKQLDGALNDEIKIIRENIIDIIANLEIDLDFSEENISIAPAHEIIQKIDKIQDRLRRLIHSFNYAKILSSGITMTIVGQPNVGKSTLMNSLLGEERVITSHIPGTTRDTVHENILINNVFFKLIDTAGLRETIDQIELKGIERTRSHVQTSDIILLVLDISQKIPPSSLSLIKDLIDDYKSKTIVVANKLDQGEKLSVVRQIKGFSVPYVKVSALTGAGIEQLHKVIVEKVSQEYEKFSDELVITNIRHKQIFEKTIEHLQSAKRALENSLGNEFTVVDLREALNILGEITGETITDDILNHIFANFCIGK